MSATDPCVKAIRTVTGNEAVVFRRNHYMARTSKDDNRSSDHLPSIVTGVLVVGNHLKHEQG